MLLVLYYMPQLYTKHTQYEQFLQVYFWVLYIFACFLT